MNGRRALPESAMAGYRSLLPCSLWGDCRTRDVSPARAGNDERLQTQEAAEDACHVDDPLRRWDLIVAPQIAAVVVAGQAGGL
jgi:hypothetical protein